MKGWRWLLLAPAIAIALAGCADLPARSHAVGASLRFIGEQRLAWRLPFQGTVVGGLSGIDYSPRSGQWIMESDDRSELSPARFYTAALDYDENAFRGVRLTGVHFFRQPDGSRYPGLATVAAAGGEVPDIETIRYDPLDDSIWYGSEGDRKLGFQPFVRHASADGRHLGTLPAPDMFRVWPRREYGVRNNLAFEGLSFAPDGRSLWLAMEGPLYQDGEVPTITAGAHARISRFDRAGALLAQYAYPLDPIPHAPAPGRLADNGLSEILAIDGGHLYAIERSGAQNAGGQFSFHIRLYEMDVTAATDVARLPALQNAGYVAARKRLVLDLDSLRLPKLDNIEGMAWGPPLANGHDTLVFISDDNFSRDEVTQLLLFEVIPSRKP